MPDKNGQTIIQYGDVNIFRVLHTVEQRPNYDSGRTVTSWKFLIRGVGYVNGFDYATCKYTSVEGISTKADSAAKGMKQIRWRLKERQNFKLAVGCDSASVSSGTILLQAIPTTGISITLPTGLTGYDVDDGPRCNSFHTVHVAANNIFKVVFEFEINVVLCNDDSEAANNTNGVISHRWSVSDSWDYNKRTTRVYQGILELATSEWSPHWFRYLVVPPLQPGMRREVGQFEATEDGKHLRYSVVDSEQAWSAPKPATTWDLQHSESVVNQDGLKVVTAATVTLEGESEVDKAQLIILGLYIVYAKLTGTRIGLVPQGGSVVFNDINIVDKTGPVNIVQVSASCWRLPEQIKNGATTIAFVGRAQGFATVMHDSGILGETNLPNFSLPYDPLLSTDGRPGEQTRYQGVQNLAGIFRCYWENPCEPGGSIAEEQLGTNQNLSTDAFPKFPTDVRIVPSFVIQTPDYYSESQSANLYTFHQIESQYRTSRKKVAMPIANGPMSGPGIDFRDSVAICQLASPVTYRIVRIRSQRYGEQPEFPNPETMDGIPYVPNSGLATVGTGGYPAIPQTALRDKLLGRGITRTADGGELFFAEREIVYALTRAPYPQEILKMGVNKWEADAVQATNSNQVLTNSPYA